MIPRFHLYGKYDTWKDNIQQHEDGLWARWNDVKPYIEHCQQLNLNFDPPVPEPEQREQWVQKHPDIIKEYDMEFYDVDVDDEDDDLFNLMTKHS